MFDNRCFKVFIPFPSSPKSTSHGTQLGTATAHSRQSNQLRETASWRLELTNQDWANNKKTKTKGLGKGCGESDRKKWRHLTVQCPALVKRASAAFLKHRTVSSIAGWGQIPQQMAGASRRGQQMQRQKLQHLINSNLTHFVGKKNFLRKKKNKIKKNFQHVGCPKRRRRFWATTRHTLWPQGPGRQRVTRDALNDHLFLQQNSPKIRFKSKEMSMLKGHFFWICFFNILILFGVLNLSTWMAEPFISPLSFTMTPALSWELISDQLKEPKESLTKKQQTAKWSC